VHETPWIRTKNKDKLRKGDVITVEPGAYLNGRVGVRIEDTIAVEPTVKNLTRFEKTLNLRK
ncbi:MAG: M24 family metallopeptidase, partial [Nitrososphaerales archaeon]